MKKLIFLNIWIFFFFLKFIKTGYCKSLSLDEVLSSVTQHHPLIITSQIDQAKAQSEYFSAKGNFDPILKGDYSNHFEGHYINNSVNLSIEQPISVWGTSITASWKNGQGDFPIYDIKSATFTQGEAKAGIEIPLLKGRNTDERRTRMRWTELGISTAHESFQSQSLEILKQASYKFWDWIASGRKVWVARELLEIAISRNEAIEKKIKHGDLPEIDQIDNERSILNRQAILIAAERAFQKASLELSIYYRDSKGHPIIENLEKVPKTYSIDEIIAVRNKIEKDKASSANHPELRWLGFQIQQLETEYKYAQNQLLPKLNFNFGIYSYLGVNPGNSYIPDSSAPELKAGITLEFPLFFRTANGKLQSSQSAIEKSTTLTNLAQNKLEIQLEDSIQAMNAAHQRLTLAQKEITISIKLEESERKRAFHGDSNFLFVNLREQTTRDAMTREIDAYSDFFKANAEYYSSIGNFSYNSNVKNSENKNE